MTSLRHDEHPYGTHHGVVINRAKFGVCTSSSFGGVKTDRIGLYILDVEQVLCNKD